MRTSQLYLDTKAGARFAEKRFTCTEKSWLAFQCCQEPAGSLNWQQVCLSEVGRPAAFADPANSFHEKAALWRAAENTCYFATVNYASPGSPTTSAIVRPDGTLLSHQPYGEEGLLIADIDITAATGVLATRYRTLSS